jgi:small subunit ribosomal protein S6
MTLPAPTYDLVILLDPQVEESTRTKIVADARKAIEAEGEFLRHDEWGDRAMTYQIDHKTNAEYHLLQFHATPELLSTLNRTLRIVDEVIRFRIIKLAPGTPDAPEMPSAAGTPRPVEAEPAAAAAPSATAAEPAAVAEPAAAEIAVGEPA